jgi:hypothetical protein
MPSNNVNLTPVVTGNTFKKWEMSLNNGSKQGPGHYPNIDVNSTTGNTITFTIVNPNGIEFATPYPIYVRAGTAKPGTTVDPQFTYSVGPDTHNNPNAVLTLTDSNQTAGPYNYVLNFQDAGQLDPIINNGGPGRVESTYSTVWYAVGIVAIIAVVVLALRFARTRQ